MYFNLVLKYFVLKHDITYLIGRCMKYDTCTIKYVHTLHTKVIWLLNVSCSLDVVCAKHCFKTKCVQFFQVSLHLYLLIMLWQKDKKVNIEHSNGYPRWSLSENSSTVYFTWVWCFSPKFTIIVLVILSPYALTKNLDDREYWKNLLYYFIYFSSFFCNILNLQWKSNLLWY